MTAPDPRVVALSRERKLALVAEAAQSERAARRAPVNAAPAADGSRAITVTTPRGERLTWRLSADDLAL